MHQPALDGALGNRPLPSARISHVSLIPLAIASVVLFGAPGQAAEPTPSGQSAESRFPPLKLPQGFAATLYACDPFIEYPSVIAVGPRPGSLFVAIDYMTGLSTEIILRDEVRLLEDTDGDGYADKSTVFADGFNSIEGIAWSDNTLYVMHAPFLTALRHEPDERVAAERKDIVVGLGLPPEENPVRLHCANGVTVGRDGWLYLALGDHGCNVERPEGDRLEFNGGGILRCRPDGRDLQVFARGLRNIYDVALDDELNVFVRDNENDGGTYKQRVYHSFFGADHGYPYLYETRQDEALAPLADVGLGSSAGSVCYLAQQFPAEYRGNLICCEWGRSIVRYQLKPAGSGFAPVEQIEFAAGADNDTYPFRPTDVVVDQAGALIVSDWCDGQRPKRGRGRIYRISYAGSEKAVAGPEQQANGKANIEPVWKLAARGAESLETLLRLAESDSDPRIRVQAVRAIADITDPALSVVHHSNAGPRDLHVAERLAKLAEASDAQLMREVIIALGRLQWADAPAWIEKHVKQPDEALAHAAMQTMRRSKNWPAVLKLLDLPDEHALRPIALRCLAEQYEPVVAHSLLERLKHDSSPVHRSQYADLLARIYKQSGPWVYWGYRPPPRPANSVQWQETEAIAEALNSLLTDGERLVRQLTLSSMQREQVPTQLPSLAVWLNDERDAVTVEVILAALEAHPASEVRQIWADIVRSPQHSPENRLRAARELAAGSNAEGWELRRELCDQLEDGPALVELLRSVAKYAGAPFQKLLVAKAKSPVAEVRAAAIEQLTELKAPSATSIVIAALGDPEAAVRRTALLAAGKLSLQIPADDFRKLSKDSDAGVRRGFLDWLRIRGYKRSAVRFAIEALNDRETVLSAIKCLREIGGPKNASPLVELAKRDASTDVLYAVLETLGHWQDNPELDGDESLASQIAELQGSSGLLLRWEVAESRPPAELKWNIRFAADADGGVAIKPREDGGETRWIARTQFSLAEPVAVEFARSANVVSVKCNDRSVYEQETKLGASDNERFEVELAPGRTKIEVTATWKKDLPRFQLRFRRKSAKAEHEQLVLALLERYGNAERGRQLFLNAEKSLCIKCHRIGEQGERIGPELTGVGGRFSKIYLAESILEPSRTIAPNFESITVVLADGTIMSGIKADQSEKSITLADNQGKKRTIARIDIEQIVPLRTSTMPEGLEKRFSADEFIDLVTFLMSQKSK